jgi:hypothetical protein
VAEGVGFEPTVRFPVRLISSQVPSTAQPPFLSEAEEDSEKVVVVDCERAKRRKGEWANGRGQSGWNTLGPARHAPWRCKRQTSESRLPLLNRSGLSGASPHLFEDEDERNGKRQTSIHLFPFRIGFTLAEELVVVGKLVH